MTHAEMPCLVLALGNPLMGDDGIGSLALERLAAETELPASVRLTDGGTAGLELLPMVEDAARLLVLDAIRAGGRPGDLVTLDRDQLPRHLAVKLSPHQIDLREVLALADLRGRLPAEIVALGLEPGQMELGEPLSAAVAAGIGRLVDAVRERLEDWGYGWRLRGNGIGGAAGRLWQ
jgi:hydrogenase maturation protease